MESWDNGHMPTTEISSAYVAILIIYTLMVVISSGFVIKRRHRQPLRFRDPYLLVVTVFVQYYTNIVFSPFVSPSVTNCVLQILIIQAASDGQQVLLMARFWKLLIASHLTQARLCNDTASWIYRHPWVASTRNLWRACAALTAVLVLGQLVTALSDPRCEWGAGMLYFETVALFGFWLLIAFMTWKLRHIQDGFFVVTELKMLGFLLLVTNAVLLFWMGSFGLDNTIQEFMNISAMISIIIQMWYPLWKSYSMSGKEIDLQSTMVISPDTHSHWSQKSCAESTRVGRLTYQSCFLDILKHPDGFAAMKQFLSLEFSVENLLCWQQLYAQKRERHPDKIDDNFRNIYEVFIRNGSPNEVNINFKLKNLFYDVMKGRAIDTSLVIPDKPTETPTDPGPGSAITGIKRRLLRQLYQEIVKLMEQDSFQRFKQTQEYRDLVQYEKGHESSTSQL